MLKTFRADLHIHTCLSPCGDLKMSPQAIVDKAQEKNIDILGICDHNSAENVPAVQRAAEKLRISILPGLEVTTQEEIHLLALFNNLWAAWTLQEHIYDRLPGTNDEEAFGLQVVVNSVGEVLHFNPKLLIGASTIPIEEMVDSIHDLGGLAIASHVDKPSFSLISQLGFVPENLDLDALELSMAPPDSGSDPHSIPDLPLQGERSLPLTRASDAHFPEDIGSACTRFILKEGTLEEIKLAFRQLEDRKILDYQ
jgi:PHP family Zn ribbon phosphoesterase